MKSVNYKVKSAMCLMLMLLNVPIQAQYFDPNINYFVQGRSVTPWELSLQFGQVKLEGNNGSTTRNSLVIKPAIRTSENDVVSLTWRPKGIKNEWGGDDINVMTMNLMNTQTTVDLSNVKMDAALTFDVKVIQSPNELVTLTLQSNWNWKSRSAFPLKQVLSRLPKKKWVSVPIPLRCFDNGTLDFEKITTIFMLQTAGKMKIELGDIRLTAFPADKANCPS